MEIFYLHIITLNQNKLNNRYSVKAKKHLGQHFLNDERVAEEIANTVNDSPVKQVLEIGPGMGMLTKYLLQNKLDVHVIELDGESVDFLQNTFLQLSGRIIEQDVLQWDPRPIYGNGEFAIFGNFPYNISSQILFKTLDWVDQVPFFSGLFQKEVAERVAKDPGSKEYGILSVLCQAQYDVEYLFTVDPSVFDPPPKVKSGVLQMVRKENYKLDCNEKLFRTIVKAGFNLRRKTLRNALKKLNFTADISDQWWASKRAEQLHWKEFIEITNWADSHEL